MRLKKEKKKKINTFEKVLDMCFKKILHCNQNYSDYYCLFIVPNFVFGLPLYNIIECCGFLIEKLVSKGFEVYLAIPTTLHISWKPKDSINKNYNTRPQLKYYNSEYKSNTNNILNNNIDNFSTKQIAIKNKNELTFNNYNNNNNNNNNHKSHNNNHHQYKPIEDYKQSNNIIYDSNDLELFKNKLDTLFD